ncbi:hypothetical protein BD408DRAFT_438485 [Parasitella parasitica]|nr:hypothetical protein BD408DRAFT_438485 [Parasitella parasitica]
MALEGKIQHTEKKKDKGKGNDITGSSKTIEAPVLTSSSPVIERSGDDFAGLLQQSFAQQTRNQEELVDIFLNLHRDNQQFHCDMEELIRANEQLHQDNQRLFRLFTDFLSRK